MSSYIFADPRQGARAPLRSFPRQPLQLPLFAGRFARATSEVPGKTQSAAQLRWRVPRAATAASRGYRIFAASASVPQIGHHLPLPGGGDLAPHRRWPSTAGTGGARRRISSGHAAESGVTSGPARRSHAGQGDRTDGGLAPSGCLGVPRGAWACLGGAGRCPSGARWPQPRHKLRPERCGVEAWP